VRKSPERLKGYLTSLIRNVVVDVLRKQGGWRRKRGREVALEEAEHVSSPEVSPEDAVRLKVLLDERLDELMAQQPADRQAILPLLRERCSGAEIARELGLDRHIVQEVINWVLEQALA
jgi:DNA-directed RNA polymerase specialized sigma24 family protein